MITIFHNPRCSKSCAAMNFLQEQGVDLQVVTYLDGSVTEEQLREVLRKLNYKPMDLVRTNEDLWKEQFAGKSFTNDELIKILVENPKLIERPIIIKDDKAVVARPTERINEIL